MTKIALTVSVHNGRIIITPPPGIELELNQDSDYELTIAEAAEKYPNVSRAAWAKACDTGGIPYVTRGKNRFIRDVDAREWAETPRARGRPKADN